MGKIWASSHRPGPCHFRGDYCLHIICIDTRQSIYRAMRRHQPAPAALSHHGMKYSGVTVPCVSKIDFIIFRRPWPLPLFDCREIFLIFSASAAMCITTPEEISSAWRRAPTSSTAARRWRLKPGRRGSRTEATTIFRPAAAPSISDEQYRRSAARQGFAPVGISRCRSLKAIIVRFRRAFR